MDLRETCIQCRLAFLWVEHTSVLGCHLWLSQGESSAALYVRCFLVPSGSRGLWSNLLASEMNPTFAQYSKLVGRNNHGIRYVGHIILHCIWVSRHSTRDSGSAV
jgi:hypothetical protein